jgi:hypothetical protein
MSKEKTTPETQDAPPKKTKAKRDVFRFNGEKPTAINLEHITHMCLEGRKIVFNFYSTAIFVELADEAAAASIFEVLLTNWSADVVE